MFDHAVKKALFEKAFHKRHALNALASPADNLFGGPASISIVNEINKNN